MKKPIKSLNTPTKEGEKNLRRIMAQINKQYTKEGEKPVIGFLSESEGMFLKRISTGIPALDEAIGTTKDTDGNVLSAGMPLKRSVELYGVPSSGKSMISLKTIANAQKQGLSCIYIDVEKTLDLDFAQRLGVDVEKLIHLQGIDEGENVMNVLCDLLKGEPGVIVLDSIAALVTKKEMEESLEQANMAIKARLMGKAIPKINTLNKGTLIIFINQLRGTLTMYGAPTTTTGGRTLPYFASIRCEIKQGEKIYKDGKKTGEIIGHNVVFQVKKNKTSAPEKKGSFEFYYETLEVK